MLPTNVSVVLTSLRIHYHYSWHVKKRHLKKEEEIKELELKSESHPEGGINERNAPWLLKVLTIKKHQLLAAQMDISLRFTTSN